MSKNTLVAGHSKPLLEDQLEKSFTYAIYKQWDLGDWFFFGGGADPPMSFLSLLSTAARAQAPSVSNIQNGKLSWNLEAILHAPQCGHEWPSGELWGENGREISITTTKRVGAGLLILTERGKKLNSIISTKEKRSFLRNITPDLLKRSI